MLLHRFNDKIFTHRRYTAWTVFSYLYQTSRHSRRSFMNILILLDISFHLDPFSSDGLLKSCNDAFNVFYLFCWIIFISWGALLLISQEKIDFWNCFLFRAAILFIILYCRTVYVYKIQPEIVYLIKFILDYYVVIAIICYYWWFSIQKFLISTFNSWQHFQIS